MLRSVQNSVLKAVLSLLLCVVKLMGSVVYFFHVCSLSLWSPLLCGHSLNGAPSVFELQSAPKGQHTLVPVPTLRCLFCPHFCVNISDSMCLFGVWVVSNSVYIAIATFRQRHSFASIYLLFLIISLICLNIITVKCE